MDATNEDVVDVAELELALIADPTNLEARGSLVQALFDRFLYDAGSESDLERIADLLSQAPDDELLYERAYLALLDGKDAVALQKLREAAVQVSQASADPFSSDELWDWLEPLEGITPEGAFEALIEGFSAGWPDSACVLTLKGLAAQDLNLAVKLFLEALQTDENYWLAADGCAAANANLKDWTAARQYYTRAIQSEIAAGLPDLRFSLALCEGKLKLYAKEAESYRACLELDPDYPFARNNMGWALMKAGKNEEAVPVLREAMERGKDGKYPMRNLANALRRLGRFREAIEVLQRDLHRGRLTASAKTEIAKLETLMSQPTQTEGGSSSPEDV